MARPARVSVNTVGIQSLFEPGGDVMRFTRKVGKEIEVVAIAKAPVGKSGTAGTLKASHRVFATPRNMYGCYAVVRNDARHSEFVHGGTGNNGASFIRPKHAKRLGPFIGLSGGIVWPSKVRGQTANPWLREAGREVMLRYGVVVRPDAD